MGIIDKLRDFMTVPEDDYDYDYNDEYEIEDYGDTMLEAPNVKQKTSSGSSSKLVNINSPNSPTQLQVVLVKPERFDDASEIADHLNLKHTVVLNLESTGKEVSRRLIDFLSGVAYANNGEIKRVANSTFIITPYNVNVMGDLLDEMESSGMF